jgi:hypothetical protein
LERENLLAAGRSWRRWFARDANFRVLIRARFLERHISGSSSGASPGSLRFAKWKVAKKVASGLPHGRNRLTIR